MFKLINDKKWARKKGEKHRYVYFHLEGKSIRFRLKRKKMK
jgi:uncharacterized membrane protein